MSALAAAPRGARAVGQFAPTTAPIVRSAALDRTAVETRPPAAPGPLFAHASEAEMARILDFYAVRWEYEPHTFPILWNLDGDVVESFAPDFYLPDLDAYLELTTLRQKLVRKKNRKLRRLRELYPGLQVKLLYGRDFRALMLKYGKLTLADSLSGTLGQVGAALTPASAMEPADAPDGKLASAEPVEPAVVATRSSAPHHRPAHLSTGAADR